MEKIFRFLLIPVLAAPLVYLFIVWKELPPTVALHFNIDGQPDRMGSRNELITSIIVLSVVSFLVWLLLVNIHRIDPKRHVAENRGRMQRLGFGMAVFMSMISCMIIYSAVNNAIGFSSSWILAATGLLFSFIGNYMPNIKPNYFAGFRLPWTLENEDNWKKTHALVGRLWFPGGLLIAVVCIFLPSRIAFYFFMTIMLVITLVPIIFSYRYFQQQKKSTNNNL
jgi:uncharacterized membrane protein